MERTVILYHGGCPDGFGGAYAAWKKFGDSAEYIQLNRHAPESGSFHGAHLYFIDFTYPQEIMDRFVAEAANVTVLDHHEGLEQVVKTMPEYRYATDRSGAGIAWEYFHPDTPVPLLLQFVEDDDLFRFALPETRAVMTYVMTRPQTFEEWDSMVQTFENTETRDGILTKANIYEEYFEKLADIAVEKAHLVSFEGYECLFANCHPLKTLKSRVGHMLAAKKGPIGLVVSAHPKGYGISIRGDGTVDVAAIAQKYGGNGHTSSAGFAVPLSGPLPWTPIEDEDTSD